jgi:hypothetical protein
MKCGYMQIVDTILRIVSRVITFFQLAKSHLRIITEGSRKAHTSHILAPESADIQNTKLRGDCGKYIQ